MIDLSKIKKIYFVGIKGVGMCSLAIYCKQAGFEVEGSDVEEKYVTDPVLADKKIKVKKGFLKENVNADIDLVIATGAHGGMTNPEVIYAQKLGIPVLTQAAALGLVSWQKRTVAVCGVGGKSTVSAMLATVFYLAGEKPSYVVGVAQIGPIGAGGGYGTGEFMILEADEYCACSKKVKLPRFSFLKPEIVVLTNLEYDHPDFYADFDQTKKTFLEFIGKIKKDGYLVINWDNDNNREFIGLVKEKFGRKIKVVTYGFGKKADIRIVNERNGVFELSEGEKNLGKFKLKISGKMNVANATAAIVVCRLCGLSELAVKDAIGEFLGTKRRFEKIGEKKGILLFDDYAHHPREIEAVLAMAADKFSDKRIIVVFQPHTFSRTKALMAGFGKSLARADLVYLTEIFSSARERSDGSIDGADLAREIEKNKGRGKYFDNEQKLVESLAGELAGGDLVITMGAGDVYKLAEMILARIK